MLTRTHDHHVDLPIPPEQTFALLHTPSAIRGWWGASRAIVFAKPGGLWVATWGASEDDPDYITAGQLESFDPPRRLKLAGFQYHAKAGEQPAFADQLATEFIVEPLPSGSRLRVVQTGFPADASADSFYAACEIGWQRTFEGVKRFVAGLS